MGGPDHAGVRIGEQDRSAVRRGYSDRERAHARDDGVRLRPVLGRPRRFGDNNLGRMRLIGREQALRFHCKRCRHAGAIFQNVIGVVVRSDAAVEARIKAARNTAGARKKGICSASRPVESTPSRTTTASDARAAA